MGGQILDYEAKRIKNEGLNQGLSQVAERMIRDGEPGEKITSYTDLEPDTINAIGQKIKVNVIWNTSNLKSS